MIRVAWVVGGIGHGGVITVCRDVAEAVARDPEFGVTLLSPDPAHSPIRPPDNVDVVTLDLPPDRDRASRGFLSWVGEHPQDIVLFNDASSVEPSWSYMPERTATIAVLHDVAIGWQQPVLQYDRSLDAVVAVSAFVRDSLLERRRHLAAPIEVIHNGRVFGPPAQRPSTGGALRLLYVGSSDPFKGSADLPRIVGALERLQVPVELVWVGSADESIVQHRVFRKAGCNLRVVGHVPHDTCLDWMARSDVLMMTSRAEPFGMVTIEAMGMGCVPVAYDAPSGTAEIVRHDRTGFLVPLGDYAAYAGAIGRLHRDRELLERLREAGMADARSRFNADRMAGEYMTLLRRIAASGPREHRQRKPAATFVVDDWSPGIWTRCVPLAVRRSVRSWAARSPRLAWRLRRWCGWGRG